MSVHFNTKLHSGMNAMRCTCRLVTSSVALFLECIYQGKGMIANLVNTVLLGTWQAWVGVAGIVALLDPTHCVAAAAQTEAATLQ